MLAETFSWIVLVSFLRPHILIMMSSRRMTHTLINKDCLAVQYRSFNEKLLETGNLPCLAVPRSAAAPHRLKVPHQGSFKVWSRFILILVPRRFPPGSTKVPRESPKSPLSQLKEFSKFHPSTFLAGFVSLYMPAGKPVMTAGCPGSLVSDRSKTMGTTQCARQIWHWHNDG